MATTRTTTATHRNLTRPQRGRAHQPSRTTTLTPVTLRCHQTAEASPTPPSTPRPATTSPPRVTLLSPLPLSERRHRRRRQTRGSRPGRGPPVAVRAVSKASGPRKAKRESPWWASRPARGLAAHAGGAKGRPAPGGRSRCAGNQSAIPTTVGMTGVVTLQTDLQQRNAVAESSKLGSNLDVVSGAGSAIFFNFFILNFYFAADWRQRELSLTLCCTASIFFG